MIDVNNIDALVFDFDGVLTDNKVLINSDGDEFVICSRSDGLAFDALRKLSFPTLILSTEKNTVVQARANKLKVTAIYGVHDKLTALRRYCYEKDFLMERILFVGNDINDLDVMKACGFSLCPSDAHPMVKQNADGVLSQKGGDAIAREIVEQILGIDIYRVLYSK